MPRLLLILVVSWAYVGCSGGAASVEKVSLEPEPGGEVRIFVGGAREAYQVWFPSVTIPMLGAGGLAAAIDYEGRSGCYRLPFDPERRHDDGRAVTPDDLIDVWSTDLKNLSSPHRWLLAPFLDADGRLQVGETLDEGVLELCSGRPVADLELRLSDSRLRYPGAGAYSAEGGLAAEPNPFWSGDPTYLDRLSRVDSTDDMGLLLRVGEVDLGVNYGVAPDRLAERLGERFRIDPLDEWSVTYALWMNPASRWVNDPRLRRFIAGSIDRDAMAEVLFAGAARPSWSLFDVVADPAWEPLDRRPLSAASRPRIRLGYDHTDPAAVQIAERLQVELGRLALEIRLEPADRTGLDRSLMEGALDAAILDHRPLSPDPILAVMETAARLGSSVDAARKLLNEGARHLKPDRRREVAVAAAGALSRDATVVPLVRVEAHLVQRRDLSGVVAEGPTLRFDGARWAR